MQNNKYAVFFFVSMGWKCKNCGNTERFTEINKVETLVSQDKDTTNIRSVFNKYAANPFLEVRCANCSSAFVGWLSSQDQPDDYLFGQHGFVSEQHTINTMVFELTGKCNLDCVYCPKEGNNELDFSLLKLLMEENSGLQRPIRHFELGWDTGNPLLHSRIKDILRIFNDFDCQVNILTNGKGFIEKVVGLNLTNISFTFFLDHPEEKQNDQMMGKGVFKSTLAAFDFLRQKGITFNVYMRMNSSNYDKIQEMDKLVKDYGANSLTPTEIYPLGKAENSMLMTDEMKQKVLKDIGDLSLNKSIHFSQATLNANCSYQRKQRIFINSDGNLCFCHFLPMQNTVISDIRDRHLLEIIQINNKARIGFLKNKERLFADWKKPRAAASPCSYCINCFGIDKEW
jgi:MoaA/NifB/PqqE/SkfB family radical SAM enzyme